jgi:ATP-dependent DNA helicase PIF1
MSGSSKDTLSLAAVARLAQVDMPRVVAFLRSRKIQIESKPSARLTLEQAKLVQEHFHRPAHQDWHGKGQSTGDRTKAGQPAARDLGSTGASVGNKAHQREQRKEAEDRPDGGTGKGVKAPTPTTARAKPAQDQSALLAELIAKVDALQGAVERLEEEKVDLERKLANKPPTMVLRGLAGEPDQEVTITHQFKEVIERVAGTNDNLFITGKAGTGKSTLLKLMRQESEKNVLVVAFTGIAALNVNGRTINSQFKFPLHVIQNRDIKLNREQVQLFRELELLIVDEVSMVRSDMLSAMDKALRQARGESHRALPFGGVQVVLFGDPFQLAPVAPEYERSVLTDTEGGVHFFQSPSYVAAGFTAIELEHVFRQENDPDFLKVINEARNGRVSQYSMAKLNSRIVHKELQTTDTDGMLLMARNAQVTAVNEQMLKELPGETGPPFKGVTTGRFERAKKPAPEELYLKVGAKVMMLKNQDGYVNGTIGTIHSIHRTGDSERIEVRIGVRVLQLNKAEWTDYEYRRTEPDGKWKAEPCGSYFQYPVKLAWAITVHKSQGLTFDKVTVDLGEGAFAHGQTYVALSRCRSLEGLRLHQPLTTGDMRVEVAVTEFFERGYKPDKSVLRRLNLTDLFNSPEATPEAEDQGERDRPPPHTEADMPPDKDQWTR